MEELSQVRVASNESAQLKQQNTELRAKVIRQDAAWKRKIESERRRGHIVDLGKTAKSLPLGNCTGAANIAEDREEGATKDTSRAVHRAKLSSSQTAVTQGSENTDGKAWL